MIIWIDFWLKYIYLYRTQNIRGHEVKLLRRGPVQGMVLGHVRSIFDPIHTHVGYTIIYLGVHFHMGYLVNGVTLYRIDAFP